MSSYRCRGRSRGRGRGRGRGRVFVFVFVSHVGKGGSKMSASPPSQHFNALGGGPACCIVPPRGLYPWTWADPDSTEQTTRRPPPRFASANPPHHCTTSHRSEVQTRLLFSAMLSNRSQLSSTRGGKQSGAPSLRRSVANLADCGEEAVGGGARGREERREGEGVPGWSDYRSGMVCGSAGIRVCRSPGVYGSDARGAMRSGA
jgi:hypothetical protein